MTHASTIYALSSGSDRAGVAVIRLSGPRADAGLAALGVSPLPHARLATLARLTHPITRASLDQALVLRFPGPKSFTGETVVELHVHGGRAVVRGVLEALGTLDTFRPAEAGEFTRRAFENGKLDLTGAEALADLIDAETERQRAQALDQLTAGRLRTAADGWRTSVLEALALVEAAIDFSDESDVAQDAVGRAAAVAEATAQAIAGALADGHRGEIVRSGVTVAIVGPPNAGKSSLLNKIAAREAAIVSEDAGTTRDVIDVLVDLAGVPVLFSDTAGLREGKSSVEREGIKRAMARAKDSHLILLISSPDVSFCEDDYPDLDLAGRTAQGDVVRVLNKADLNPGSLSQHQALAVSCFTGAGFDDLLLHLASKIQARIGDGAVPPLITHTRHRALLQQTLLGLQNFYSGVVTEYIPIELAAEELRQASSALGRITGRFDPEEVLGAIFGRFCIGK